MIKENIPSEDENLKSDNSYIQFCLDEFDDEITLIVQPQEKKRKNKILIMILVATLLFAGYFLFLNKHFKSLTLEAGSEPINVESFCKSGVNASKVVSLTNLDIIDYYSIGEYDIEFLYNNKVETVRLKIVDTTKPKVVFKNVEADDDYKITATDFVDSIDDATEIEVEINLTEINGYGVYDVEVKVTDAGGNFVKEKCKLEIFWLREEYNAQINRELHVKDLVSKDQYINYVDMQDFNNVDTHTAGDYQVHGRKNDVEYTCTIHILDQEAPILVLQDIEREGLDNYKDLTIKSFIVSIEDDSEVVELKALDKIDFSKEGRQEISVMAKDIYGNETVETATYTLIPDIYGPTFSGIENMKYSIGSEIDFIQGVSVVDKKDGKVNFKYDASSVNTSEAGIYYVTYEAIDSAGNKTTEKRMVEIY